MTRGLCSFLRVVCPILEEPTLEALLTLGDVGLPDVALTRGPVVLVGRATTSLRERTDDVGRDAEVDDVRIELLELVGRDDMPERLRPLVEGELL